MNSIPIPKYKIKVFKQNMLTAIASIIIAVAVTITSCIQTITLSGCKKIDCCFNSCELSEIENRNTIEHPITKSDVIDVDSTNTDLEQYHQSSMF